MKATIINKTGLEICGRIPLVSNNYKSIFLDVEFSTEWAGLSKTAVFTNGDVIKKVLNPVDSIPVPVEVLEHGKEVLVAFYGERIENGEKVISLATHYASLGAYVSEGADPNVPPVTPPTPEIWEQLQSDVNELDERVTELEQGFEGTEAEWLESLEGAPGEGISVVDEDADDKEYIMGLRIRDGYPVLVLTEKEE